MQSLRPLHSYLRRVLFLLTVLAFVVTGAIVGRYHYTDKQKEVAKILEAQIKIAQSLIPSLLLAEDRHFQGLSELLEGVGDKQVLGRIRDESRRVDPFDIYYVLNKDGQIVEISDRYRNYLGLNPSHMDHIRDTRKVSRVYQSIFSKRTVVALKYQLNTNLQLVHERDISNIMPALIHLEKGRILAGQELILLTSLGVVVHHRDQSLVKTRYNLAFDMKNLQGPNKRGLYSYNYHGRNYYAVKESLENPQGWEIYLQVPSRPLIVSIAKAISLQLFEILCLFLAASFTLQYVLNRFFSKPVADIVEALNSYTPGGRSEVLAPKETGVKEFARISQAINEMAQEVFQSTERFRVLVDSLDAMVYVADMDTYEILFLNEYGKEIFGDIVGKTCWQSLQSGQEGPCPFCTNHLLLDSAGIPKPTHVWEFQNTVTGQWYECRDQAILWSSGHLARMEIALDITFRKKAENALEAEKERLAVTLRSIGDGVITTDTEGKVLLLNRAAEKMTGWAQEEAAGRSLREVFQIVNALSRELCENPVERVLTTSRSANQSSHTILISKEGVERNISESGAPICNKKSEIVGVVLVFRDETEKLRLEEESSKAKKLESVGVLARGISLDFNNILTAILGNINLAVLDSTMNDDTKKLLENAEKASVRAKHLTQQLLTFAKGGEPVKESALVANVIKDSANFVLHGSNVSCQYDIQDDLWVVEVDHGQISQVIQNLIINAKEAMPDGGMIEVGCSNIPAGAIDKSIPLSPEGKYVKITIKDNGPGIPAEILERIFDPYFTTKDKGNGLGLAICHSIINKHEGHLAVEATSKRGSVFSIHLPAADASLLREVNGEVATATPKAARIMVMDDDDMIRAIAEQMLAVEGHEVLQARSGSEALSLYKESMESAKNIDVVIMDLTIPGGMGGKEAVKEILAIDPSAQVVVSSGYSNDPIMAKFKEYGFVAALDKPFRMQALFKVINKVLVKK